LFLLVDAAAAPPAFSAPTALYKNVRYKLHGQNNRKSLNKQCHSQKEIIM